MTEVKVIKNAIKRDNRSAYRMAKAADNAYVINGRTIYRVSSNGSKVAVKKVDSGLVKVKSRVIILD